MKITELIKVKKDNEVRIANNRSSIRDIINDNFLYKGDKDRYRNLEKENMELYLALSNLEDVIKIIAPIS